ncbi:RIP metalloprotease RseP [candidate division WOR-3 bacterium]|nr:RIP metalloprotease RseP [candidate division WOR-3 bacterium]
MLVTILAFLFILAFSITIHEFGHFLVAKLFKIPVEKFSIGYGPPLIRMKIGETDFRIAYFPLGGYVKIAGEEEPALKTLKTNNTENTAPHNNTEDTESKDPLNTRKGESDKGVKGFYDAPIYKRVMIVLAGPVFNILSAVIVFSIIAGVYGLLVNPFMKVEVQPDSEAARAGLLTNDSIVAVSGYKVKDWDELYEILLARQGQEVAIGYVRNNAYQEQVILVDIDSLGISPVVPPVLGSLKLNGPAQRAGMKPGVRVLQIEDRAIETWNQMIEVIRRSRDIPLHFTWDDRGEIKSAQITPAKYYDPISQDTIGQIGAIMPLERHHLPFVDVVSFSVRRSGEVLVLTVRTLYQLVVGRISRRALGGPIAIAQLSGESARWGFENLLGLLAIISINLGLVNLFPIPALDGGHVIIAVIEAIRRRRFSVRTRMIIQQVGYALILLLIVYVTFNDITR